MEKIILEKKTHWSGCDDLELTMYLSEELVGKDTLYPAIYPKGNEATWPEVVVNIVGTHKVNVVTGPFLQCGKIGVTLHLKFAYPQQMAFLNHYDDDEKLYKREQGEKLRIAAYYLNKELDYDTQAEFEYANQILSHGYENFMRQNYYREDGRYSPNLASARVFYNRTKRLPNDVKRVNLNIFEKDSNMTGKLVQETENSLIADGMFGVNYRDLPYFVLAGTKKVAIPDHPCLKGVEFYFILFSNKWLDFSPEAPHKDFLTDMFHREILNVNAQVERFKHFFRVVNHIPYQLHHDVAIRRWNRFQWLKSRGRYEPDLLEEFHDPIEWDINIYDEKFN